ncbi:MAG: glycosyltransferase family 2 protein [Eubacterium sp.]|nr:glycosyltransferase family 2 protein [Eubacterium sp.]
MVGIVILNYENWDDTKCCVESIYKNTHGVDYQIILVDNASMCAPSFDLEAFLKRYKIQFIKNKKNTGYNAGNNLGIAMALKLHCDQVLVSNNDVRFFQGSIKRLQDCLKSYPRAGIAGPKVLDPSGYLQKSCICKKTGLKEKYLVRTRANFIFRKSRRAYFGDDRNYKQMFEAYAVLGCCFMMTEQCARAVTPFDEHPFLYEEELMLGIRMEEQGFVTIYCPSASVVHLHGASTRRRKAFAFIQNVRSEIYYCRSYLHAKNWQVYPLYCYRVALYLMRCIRYRDFRKNWRRFLKITQKEFH